MERKKLAVLIALLLLSSAWGIYSIGYLAGKFHERDLWCQDCEELMPGETVTPGMVECQNTCFSK